MTSISNSVLPQYLGSGDPALKDYFPAWVNNIPPTPLSGARC
jgi:hypothetical protein